MFLAHLISYASQFFCAVYIFKKILHLSNPTKDTPLVDICASFLFSVLLSFNEFTVPTFRVIALTLCVLVLGVMYYKRQLNIGVVASVISAGFSYAIYIIGLSLAYPITFLLSRITGFQIDSVVSIQITRIITGIIQTGSVFLLFKIPRLRKGMRFLQRDNIKDAGVFIALILLSSTILVGNRDVVQYAVGIVLACGMTLFVWWNSKLQASYRDKQNEIHIQMLEQEVEQYRQEEATRDELDYNLSRQIHEDRRIIPALYSQLQYLSEIATFENSNVEQEYRRSVEAISAVIEKQYERAASYEDTHKAIPSTGVGGADIMIRYMADKAIAEGVGFECVVERDLNILLEVVSEYNLSIVLGDLIGNALRAVKTTAQKRILLKIHEVKQFYCAISVYDSGVDFSPETILRLGRQRASTHPEDGTGIGLMSTYEIVHASLGTYELDETINEPPYTKVITIRFDFRNHTVVRSERDEIISLREQRPEIVFIRPQDED